MRIRFLSLGIILVAIVAFLIMRESPTTEKSASFASSSASITAESWNASKNIDAAFSSIESIQNRMNKNNSTSDVAGINNGNTYWGNSQTIRVINRGIFYGNLSNGAFDISIGALEDLYASNPNPSQSDIDKAKSLVNYKNLTIWQPIPKGMSIDLRYMVDGYAADEAVFNLRQAGSSNIMVNIGKCYVTSGGKQWKIGLHNPFDTDSTSYMGSFSIAGRAVATTDSSENVIDPRTGKPVDNNIASATVITTLSGIDASAMSNMLFIMGQSAFPIIESQDAEGIIITNDHKVYTTFGEDDNLFKITDNSFTYAQ